MPLIRYLCLVGPALLGLLFLLSEPDQKPSALPASERWTSADALRAMAHIGEPVRDRERDIRFARTAIVSAARAEAAQPAVLASQKPSLMNAEARMTPPAARRVRPAKPHKARMAARSRHIRAAVADNPQRIASDAFHAPSW
ncbi:MAG TPA: hypothetical protein VFQ87_19530 [Bradyrhizobium sp.]|nr:hypothetical protein [Bradyrhizobium sp.]